MVPVLVEVEVKPERLDEFLEVMRQDAVGSRTEPGCLRFDVMQDQENPCKFVFYEVYKNAEAAAAHRDYPHFKLWTDFKVCATGEQASATCLPAAACRPLTRRSSDRPTAWCPPCPPSPSSRPGDSRPMAPTESLCLCVRDIRVIQQIGLYRSSVCVPESRRLCKLRSAAGTGNDLL